LNGNVPTQHPLKRFDNITRPKTIWAVDIIPSMPTTTRGNTAVFVAVDMFSAYIVVKAIPSRAGQHLLEAVESCIINPFGVPKYIRCDNEAGLENSAEFYKFCQILNIDVLPTAAAAPWSNGAAERAVQTIKKNLRNFVLSEHVISDWDKYIFLVAAAHNGSIGTYGVSPEEVLFGYHYHNHAELVQMFPTDLTPDQFLDGILSKAIEARDKMRQESDKQAARVMTYRNRNKPSKTFAVGDTVLLRQHQVAVGPHGAVRAKFTGPYYIDSLNPDGCTCMVTHGRTGVTTSQHFTSLQKLFQNPEYSRLPSNFDDSVMQLMPDRYSYARHLASQQFHPRSPSQRRVHFSPDTQFGPDGDSDDSQDGAEESNYTNDSQDGADTFSRARGIHDISPSYTDSSDGADTPPPQSPTADYEFQFDNDSVFGDDEDEQPVDDIDFDLGPVTPSTPVDRSERNQEPSQTRRQFEVVDQPDSQVPTPIPVVSTTRQGNSVVQTRSNAVAQVIITEPDDLSQNYLVEVQGVPGEHITKVDVNEKTKPIKITVHHTPVDDLIRDLPRLDLSHIPIKRPPKGPTENPYKQKLQSYARPGTASRYPLRSKGPLNPSNNAQVKYFRPP
jgi:hypothetical protein